MRLAFIGGSHPRHYYYFNTIAQYYDVAGAIIEYREHMQPAAPEGIDDHDRALWNVHFGNREFFEWQAFGTQDGIDVEDVLYVDELNTDETAAFMEIIEPDLVLVFGSHMIRDPLFSELPPDTINLHLGLSPRYRGSATLFWPFYFLEPQFAGCTFHRIVHEPDAGDILHQIRQKDNRQLVQDAHHQIQDSFRCEFHAPHNPFPLKGLLSLLARSHTLNQRQHIVDFQR